MVEISCFYSALCKVLDSLFSIKIESKKRSSSSTILSEARSSGMLKLSNKNQLLE